MVGVLHLSSERSAVEPGEGQLGNVREERTHTMFFKTAAALAVTSSCLLCSQGTIAAGGVVPLTTVRVASGLNRPIFVTHAPGDSTRLFIVEQRGVIKILDLDSGTVLGTPFLDIDALVTNIAGNDERGLLGLAFHPDYQNNGFFYVDYTNNASATTIRRYSVSGDPDVADAGSGLTLLTISQPFSNHNGGWIGFGPNDGYLYIATGDGGASCDPSARAQNITTTLLGKMLRIDVDANDAGNYGIPADNPFADGVGLDAIWAYGLRNPWRNSFDRATGDLYIADVGQFTWEEINFQPADSTGAENYGWDCMEGNHCPPGCPVGACACFSPDLTDPIHEYGHGLGFSITGGYVYRGGAIPSLQGTYFFGDFGSARTWSFTYDGVNMDEFTQRTTELSPSSDGFSIGAIASFGEDNDGELYIVDRCSTSCGEVFRLVPDTATTTLDAFNAFRGFHVSGTLDDLLDSDDDDLCHQQGIVLFPTEAPITLDFFGTLPNDSPSTLDVTIESSANTVGLELTISFWNYNTSSWDVVGVEGQSFNNDVVRTFSGTPADHVQMGTGAVITRYEVRQTGLIFVFPFTDCIDQVFWTTSG